MILGSLSQLCLINLVVYQGHKSDLEKKINRKEVGKTREFYTYSNGKGKFIPKSDFWRGATLSKENSQFQFYTTRSNYVLTLMHK